MCFQAYEKNFGSLIVNFPWSVRVESNPNSFSALFPRLSILHPVLTCGFILPRYFNVFSRTKEAGLFCKPFQGNLNMGSCKHSFSLLKAAPCWALPSKWASAIDASNHDSVFSSDAVVLIILVFWYFLSDRPHQDAKHWNIVLDNLTKISLLLY